MKKSRIFSLVLAVTLCMVMLSSTFMIKTSAAITGSGTESDPYIITSDSDLSKMKGSKSCFKLGQDIYLSSDNWIPINFYGVLDGNGYTLKNYRNTNSSTAQVALFSTNYGTIRNLTVQCEVYHRFYSPSSDGQMGGICITNEGNIENCNVTGSLEGIMFHDTSRRSGYIGGICVYNIGTIQDCGIYADVIGNSYSYYCYDYAGGVCVTNREGAIITRCVVKNYTRSDDGGSGIAQTNKGTISECCVASKLYVTGSAIAQGGTIENCISFSELHKGSAIGNGYKNCINAGIVRFEETKASDSYNDSYDLGDLCLVSSGYGLVMDRTYTEADFPALDFKNIWYITDYGVPYLRNLNLSKPQSVNIDCEDKLYMGGTTEAELEILPKNAVLYSLSVSFTEGEHETTWGSWVSKVNPTLDIKPVSVGSTRLIVSDAIASVLGFKNFNFVQGVESITVTGPTRMAVGQTIKLTAVANPSNAENTNIKFVESPTLPRRLTVTADGTVTANYLGKAWLYIQSEDGNVSETYWIDVVNLPTSVKLSDTKVTLYPGETRQLNASIAPQDAEDTSCRWESSNPSVATVNTDGLVTPVSYGTAVIKAICNDGGAYGQCEVTVAKRPNNFTLSGPDTIVVGETATYKLEALPSDTVIRETSWQVDNESVVKIEQIDLTTVKITGIVGGKSQLQVFANDRTISLDINVVRYPDSVDIAEEEIFMTVGQQEQLSAKVSPEDTTDKTTTWTSDNNMVASVSADGKITAHKIGEATISCTTADGKKSDHVLVRVQIPAFALEVDETDITLYVNRSCKINATVQPENATYKNVVLKPSNNLLKVDQETMTIHGLQPGTCVLWVSTPDGSLSKPIFVTILESANNPITSIAITSRPNKVIYHDGENFDKSGMSVTAYYSDGFSEEVTDYILSGYNSTPGTKVITVTYHEFTTTFTVDVLARCGDVNSDSKTNSSDALLILQYSVGKITEIDATYADANHDGRINSSDALIALQISVGNYNGDLWFNIEDDFATTHQIKS